MQTSNFYYGNADTQQIFGKEWKDKKRERFNINLELKYHTVLLPGNFPDPTHFPRQIFAISALGVKNSLCLGEGLLNGCVELP